MKTKPKKTKARTTSEARAKDDPNRREIEKAERAGLRVVGPLRSYRINSLALLLE